MADEVGIEQLTLAAVAQRFGVALPSLHKHVSGLDGLQRDLVLGFGMPETIERSFRLMIEAIDVAFTNWKSLR